MLLCTKGSSPPIVPKWFYLSAFKSMNHPVPEFDPFTLIGTLSLGNTVWPESSWIFVEFMNWISGISIKSLCPAFIYPSCKNQWLPKDSMMIGVIEIIVMMTIEAVIKRHIVDIERKDISRFAFEWRLETFLKFGIILKIINFWSDHNLKSQNW